MSDSISCKVAAIIDDTTLVLSAGSGAGVCEGMVFAIVSTHQDIADPDTGQSLGTWEAVKARVVVSHVQERMCTARSLLREEVDASGTLSTLMVRHSFGLYGSRSEERQSLDVLSGSRTGRPKVQPIEVGDLARGVSLEGVAVSGDSAIAERPSTPAPVSPDLPSKTYQSTAAAPPPAASAPAAVPSEQAVDDGA